MKDRRGGYAIIELLIVMTSLVVIFGLCVALIHALLKLDRSSRAHLAEASTRDRFVRQFRSDARARSRLQTKPGGHRLS